MAPHPATPSATTSPLARVVFPQYGRTDRVVFAEGVTRRLLLDVMSFERRPDALNPRRWATGMAAAGVAATDLRHAIQRGRRR